MIESKSLATLEYSKILSQVAHYAYSAAAQVCIENIKPSVSLDEVNELLGQTLEADKLLFEHCILPSLAVDDIEDILKSAEKLSTLSIEEILKIGRVLKVARATKGLIVNVNDDSIKLLKGLCYNLYFNVQLENSIEESFVSDTEVSDNASSNLKKIRNDIKSCNARIKQKLSQYISSSDYSNLLQDNLITMRNNRYVVPLKSECKGQIAGLVHDRSATGSTLFVEPLIVVELNNELRQLQMDEQKEIQMILVKFTTDIQREIVGIAQSFNIIIQLDCIFAKANYSKAIKGILPLVNDKGLVDIIDGRHPLIDSKKVVPVSINLGKTFNTLVITGPNTGGKTVTLKLVGALCLMAMSGIFIPTNADSQVAVFDSIFCDIGDEQSIEQNLSTFSSHLKNLVHITDNLTSNSLVLLDELGAGTDPIEGSALAIAVIDYFRGFNAKVLTTSHYNELKEYSYVTQGVCNASMDFNPKTYEPTYKLHIGLSGSSNALEIASSLGLKTAIIDNAKSKLSSEKLSFDKIIASAENSRREAEELKRQAEI
ncbi:MAG: endonuclease MutS2, partial [Clostridia bacterium]